MDGDGDASVLRKVPGEFITYVRQIQSGRRLAPCSPPNWTARSRLPGPGRETAAGFVLEKVTGRGKRRPLGVSVLLAERCCHLGSTPMVPMAGPCLMTHQRCVFREQGREES